MFGGGGDWQGPNWCLMPCGGAGNHELVSPCRELNGKKGGSSDLMALKVKGAGSLDIAIWSAVL